MTSAPPEARQRPRDLGISIGLLPTGTRNTIADVPGIRVGHATVWHDEPYIARSGVTAIVSDSHAEQFRRPMSAGTAVLNGAGELTGTIAINEWGWIETPILLTNTMGVGAAYSAAVAAMVAECPEVGVEDVVVPVVGECDDSFLNTARALPITTDVAAEALRDVAADFRGGAIGAGAGMTCFDFKGGIGSSSRVLDGDVTVGVLALTNFGDMQRLTVDGALIGRRLAADGFGRSGGPTPPAGSCIVVVATDAPLTAPQCSRLARRAGLGLARTGSVAYHGSGEIFVAFSTTARVDRDEAEPIATVARRSDRALGSLFEAVVDATEEAVLDSLFQADTVVGRDGNTSPAFPVEQL